MQKLEEKEVFSVAELAKILGISRVAVFNRIKKGQIVAKQVGRAYVIERKDVEHLLPDRDQGFLSTETKQEIDKAVGKAVKDYGETLKLLGKE